MGNRMLTGKRLVLCLPLREPPDRGFRPGERDLAKQWCPTAPPADTTMCQDFPI
jgi:hypothetical protein